MQLYNSKYAYGDASDFAKLVFRAYDADDDGKVEFNEFICCLKGIRSKKCLLSGFACSASYMYP